MAGGPRAGSEELLLDLKFSDNSLCLCPMPICQAPSPTCSFLTCAQWAPPTGTLLGAGDKRMKQPESRPLRAGSVVSRWTRAHPVKTEPPGLAEGVGKASRSRLNDSGRIAKFLPAQRWGGPSKQRTSLRKATEVRLVAGHTKRRGASGQREERPPRALAKVPRRRRPSCG